MTSKKQTTPPPPISRSSKIPQTEAQQKIAQFCFLAYLVVVGEKGGTGKSFFTSLLIAYLLQLLPKEKLAIFDCDRSNSTTKAYWGDELKVSTEVSFTENEDKNFKGDALIETLADPISTIVVDTPAQVSRSLYHAFTEAGLLESADILKAKFIIFYVCQADSESTNQFIAWLQQFNVIKNVVLVKNLYRASVNDWETLMSDKTIISAKKRYGFVEMYLPELKKPESTIIQQQKLSLNKALERVNLCGKTRLLRYQRQLFDNLDAAFVSLIEKSK
jgi:hypothetical protein